MKTAPAVKGYKLLPNEARSQTPHPGTDLPSKLWPMILGSAAHFLMAKLVSRARFRNMLSPRQRPIFIALAAVAVVWMVSWGGYRFARHSKVTAESIRAYAMSVDLGRLSGDARARAIRRLADQINALSAEERRQARMESVWARWFEQMTEAEKGAFIEATMPTGFRQMLSAFEELPEEKRRKALNDALRRLREARDSLREDGPSSSEVKTNARPALSEDLQQKVATIGLRTYYGSSSAQTKAELAPLLEEMQRMMESGALFRGRR